MDLLEKGAMVPSTCMDRLGTLESRRRSAGRQRLRVETPGRPGQSSPRQPYSCVGDLGRSRSIQSDAARAV
jgi:hypothetical protein